MNEHNYCYLGYISKLHGKEGNVIAVLDTNVPDRYFSLEMVWIKTDPDHPVLVPFYIESIGAYRKRKVLIKFADYNSPEDLKPVLGKEFYITEEVVESTDHSVLSGFDITGALVVTVNGEQIGTAREIMEYPSNAVLVVEDAQSNEILIPVTEEIIKKTDREKREIHVTLPEGLLELYKNG